MIKLWGRANSSNVMKVIWLLEELGLKYDRVDVGGPFGGTSTPEYRAMNPLGVVPSLEEEGGFTLFESNSILRYLCNAHAPASPLYPQAPRTRAQVDTWLDFQQTALNRPQGTVFQGLVRIPPEKRDNAAIAAAITEVAGIWGILDARLASQPYVTGAAFTLADIAFGVHVHRWFVLPVPGRPEAANLHAWYQRLLARPAYKAHCAGPVT
ncbi:glutathione S-transferase family protein [Limobrevibacterium gyesilva]|uniref:Glutathione S-transferase family protein n=1 Tax=Limobrevibacterium gyesilva TaxID=2991712 RepID=A0AA41YL67_9PROT|nr:glutathione S-transferase family protein [Limobrevibacterium gyesilva]MCW3474431.1 glutathione S-transferase family protein [Limobrevibacterium gyesilva]